MSWADWIAGYKDNDRVRLIHHTHCASFPSLSSHPHASVPDSSCSRRRRNRANGNKASKTEVVYAWGFVTLTERTGTFTLLCHKTGPRGTCVSIAKSCILTFKLKVT